MREHVQHSKEQVERESNPNQRSRKMNRNIFSAGIVHVVVLTMLTISGIASRTVQAQTTWTGGAGTSDWRTAGNWSNGEPVFAQATRIENVSDVVDLNRWGGTARLYVSAQNGTPVLNITTGAELEVKGERFIVGGGYRESNYGGIVNHTGGTVNISGTTGDRRLDIAARNDRDTDTGNSGTYNFGGSALTAPTLTGVASGIRIGWRPGEDGLLSMSGYGTFTPAGLVSMSQNNGDSEWRIAGGNLDIRIGGDLRMGVSGGGSATIWATIDNTGFSTINIGGDVIFGGLAPGGNPSRFILNLGEGYQHVHGREFLIIDAAGDFTNYGMFGLINGTSYTPGDLFTVNGYEFYADYRTGNSGQFVVTAYIPEPSSGLLLLLPGGLALMRRRRPTRG